MSFILAIRNARVLSALFFKNASTAALAKMNAIFDTDDFRGKASMNTLKRGGSCETEPCVKLCHLLHGRSSLTFKEPTSAATFLISNDSIDSIQDVSLLNIG